MPHSASDDKPIVYDSSEYTIQVKAKTTLILRRKIFKASVWRAKWSGGKTCDPMKYMACFYGKTEREAAENAKQYSLRKSRVKPQAEVQTLTFRPKDVI